MIDINSYRCRIGSFSQNSCKRKMRKLRKIFRKQGSENDPSGVYILSILQAFVKIVMIFVLLETSLNISCNTTYQCVDTTSAVSLVVHTTAYQLSNPGWIGAQLGQPYYTIGKHQTPNYQARYLHGNRKRGVLNMHVNIRSLYNKMTEVKNPV